MRAVRSREREGERGRAREVPWRRPVPTPAAPLLRRLPPRRATPRAIRAHAHTTPTRAVLARPPGRSVFNLSLSGSPPPWSGAPGPPKQKTKTDRFLTVT